MATIQHRCAQHVDVSGYYKANSHPHATGSPLVSRMIVLFDIAVAAGGEASVWGLPLTVSVGCRPWLDLHGTTWVAGGGGRRRRQRFFATVDLNQNRTKRNTEKSAGPNIYLLLHTSHVDFVPQSPKTRSDRPNNCSLF